MFTCPICKEDKPMQAIPIKWAGLLCLLCETESVCLSCQITKHRLTPKKKE